MKKNIYFDRFGRTRFAATTENGKLVEFEMESEDTAEIVGNIYKGRVVNVLGGMEAAFVYCGLARNGYLSAADMNAWEGEEAPAAAPHALSVKEGDEVLVQVVKSPRGNKGAKITTRLSFVGKDLIYMPDSDFIGVSHKIVDEELRETLTRNVRELSGGKGGFIIRTSAPYASEKQLKEEIELLRRRHQTVLERAKTAAVGEAIFVESTMPAKVLRNLIPDEIEAIVASEEKIYGEISEVLGYRDTKMAQKLRLYGGDRDMLYAEGVSQQLDQILTPYVDLPNGAGLVIEKTEALTVIDVNTAKYVGDDDLEQTALTTNLLAAREIAAQVRLRNIGGIVVVDFINMEKPEHRAQVTEELEFYLAQDRMKVHVLPMSEFGLVEFTRRRTSNESMSQCVRACPYCGGSGQIIRFEITIIRIKRDIVDCFADGYTAAVVELNELVMKEILSKRMFTEYLSGAWKGKRLYFVPHKTYHEAQYTVRGDNSGVLHLPDKAQIAY